MAASPARFHPTFRDRFWTALDSFLIIGFFALFAPVTLGLSVLIPVVLLMVSEPFGESVSRYLHAMHPDGGNRWGIRVFLLMPWVFIAMLVGSWAVNDYRFAQHVEPFESGALIGLPRSEIEARYDDGKWDAAIREDSYCLGSDGWMGLAFVTVRYDANARLVDAVVIYD